MEALTLPFSALSDKEAASLLAKYSIGLTVEEARKVEKMLKRPPTVTEAVIWGIQGSEHCSYKSSRRFLKMFPTSGKHVILGPKEDSGIVALTDGPKGKRWGIVVSHESHNHPSQIVPFEGAATGVGGTVRDVACMGARVVGCMDMLRLGDLKTDESRTIAKEVMRGIGGYGNPLGVPNLGGDTYFDSSFNNNCLVNAIAIGIVREDEIIHSFVPAEAGKVGYDIIIVGKPTDRSGFGGAAFASASMQSEDREQNTGAVQEPNPFLERHLLASTYALFDWLAEHKKLDKISFKDLGAGGVVCASVEQVAALNLGAEISLDRVHTALPDLPPEVIGCAETQERFCWICHPDLTDHILRHYNEAWDLPSVAENARASVIGKVTTDGVYHLTYHGQTVCKATSRDITSGLQYKRPTQKKEPSRSEPVIHSDGPAITLKRGSRSYETTVAKVFKAMLAHPNHASKSAVFRHFDKTVIGNAVLEAGEADASVITPLQDLQSYTLGGSHPGWTLPAKDAMRGAVFGAGGNPRYGKISAHAQGYNAAIEAMCNVAAVGATPRALTDCLNYGNPELPSHLSALEEGVKGIAKAAKGIVFGDECVPVISGNVSLYNSTPDGSAIPPSAIVCCIGVLEDARKAVPMRWQKPGSALLLVGKRKDECGGSAFYEVLETMAGAKKDELLGSRVPSPVLSDVADAMRLVIDVSRKGLVRSCHDISDGGLLLALFEMSLPQRKVGGSVGASIDLGVIDQTLSTSVLLFSQTPGFVLEVSQKDVVTIQRMAKNFSVPCFGIGKTTKEEVFHIELSGRKILGEKLPSLRTVWEEGLAKALEGRQE